ncbi:peptide methionine sulfoxide reductase isoform X2 [Culicoides brevitarsis]|uniref:peptide methionine sulfoxide reductase isoform X2 n=1 Tax=Culicoides brevitarsis TaxID=469753 RepID=UPI00307C77ED
MLSSLAQHLRRIFGRQAAIMVETKNVPNGNGVHTDASPKPLHTVNIPFERATFGMGCFWSCDSLFGAQKGVLRTRVGYSGGKSKNPSYRNIADHTEVIEIDFDPEKISYNQLLTLFWNNHEYGLTTRIKTQYQSLILYHNDKQKEIAEASKEKEQQKRAPEQIITRIEKAGTFYPAEDYHQKYRLQHHKELASQLKLNPQLLQSSHVAARLNGYLVGVGGVKQFDEEAESLGLTKQQIEYVRKYVVDNEGGGLTC